MTLLLAALTMFVAHLVKGLTGFGSSLVAVPALTLLFGPSTAVATTAICDLVSGLALAPSARRDLDWRLVLAVCAPMVLGQLVGTHLLLRLPVPAVATLMALIVGSFGASLIVQPVRAGRGTLSALPDRPGRLLGYGGLAGAAGGAMAGLVGASGPPIVAFTRYYFTDRAGRAHLVAVFLLGSISLITTLTLSGAYTQETTLNAIFLLPMVVIGGHIGAGLTEHVPRETFGRLVGLLLVLSAATLLAAAARQ